jgi:hypothetical protein
MPVLFITFGLASVAALGILVLSIVLGATLCITKRMRTAGVFVLLVPPCSAVMAVALSWGLAFVCDALSHGASPAAYQRWQVLAFWAWPIGFVLGGLAGGMIGIAVAVLIVRRTVRGMTWTTI